MMETTSKKIYILIPAYNEATGIADVISNLKNSGYENILLVDDGSKDDTATIAKKAGAEVLNLVINRGQGAVLKAGIEYLRENHKPDVVVTFDADGQHQAKDIPTLIKPLEEGFDMVLGTRFLEKKSQAPFVRKLILKAGVIFTNLLSNVKLTDTHNGLRALGRKAIQEIEISHRGMEHASDIIDEISKKHLKYKEVPVEIVYTDYSKLKGQKSSAFIKMGLKILIKKITQ